LGFANHSRCLRDGFDTVEKLALSVVENGTLPRVVTHQRWSELKENVSEASEEETFNQLTWRITAAVEQMVASGAWERSV